MSEPYPSKGSITFRPKLQGIWEVKPFVAWGRVRGLCTESAVVGRWAERISSQEREHTLPEPSDLDNRLRTGEHGQEGP